MPKPLAQGEDTAPRAVISGWTELLAEITRDLATGPDLPSVLERLVHGLARLVDAEAADLFLMDDAEAALVCQASTRPTGPQPATAAPGVARDDSHPRARPLSPMGPGGSDFADLPPVPVVRRKSDRSVIHIPIHASERLLGHIEMTQRRSDREVDRGELMLLGALADAAGLTIENVRLHESIAEQEGVRRELALAAQIQRSLLPKREDENFPVFGLNRPIRQVSGDFYDFFPVPCGHIPFAVGDVSGKGIEAALLMSKTASLFRFLGKTQTDPARILSIINREICETVSRGRFVTMVAGIYNPGSGHLRFANAGHEPPLLRHPDRHYQTFPATAPPLGILPDLDIEAYDVTLGGGEFYVFTDGLTEYHFGSDEELGVEGVIQLVEGLSEETLENRMRALLNELDQGGWQVRDDLTLLAINDAHSWRPGKERHVGNASDESSLKERILELRLAARADRLPLVRANVTAAARTCGFDDNTCEDLALAVSEACQNVIVHGYQGRDDGEMRLGLFQHERGLFVRLADDCPTLDPKTVKPRDLKDIRPGGLGTHFIAEIMDEVAYRPGPGGAGNILEMMKQRDD